MKAAYILALDQGTTSSRAILFDSNRVACATSQREFTQYFPKAGWVEHDPMEIWESQVQVAREVMEMHGITAKDIAAIGITNQRETTVVWNKKTGLPIYRAIVWQDRRTAGYCDELKARGLQDYIRENTGLVVDSYFSGTKINWLLNQVPEAKDQLDDLLFGTIDSWLIWKLTNGNVHATDYSNASRTMIYNIKKLVWDQKLLKEMNIPESMLPEVRDSSGSFGNVAAEHFGAKIPITGVAGDQQAALFGQTCFESGMAKNTYGTGCFMLMNTGTTAVPSKNGLLTTIAWGLNGEVTYALEGSVFIAGAAIQWLRDGLRLIDSAPDTEYIAQKVSDTDGVYVVPAFAGLGAPHWDMYARGAIFGLTRGTTKAHLVRATLQSLAYQTKDVLEAMELDSAMRLQKVLVDGGASANNYLMQFQADIIGTPVERPVVLETTAKGAAFLAGLAVGFYELSELSESSENASRFLPEMSADERNRRCKKWNKAVERCKGWED